MSVPGRCVKLPKGSRSHNQRHCKPGETWRRGYDRGVKVTRKALKSIEGGIRDKVSLSRIGRKCDDATIAAALNRCMGHFIDPVQEHMRIKEHYGLESYPSLRTQKMIESHSQKGANCVLSMLSSCSNKDDIRLITDSYIQSQLGIDSMISPYKKKVMQDQIVKSNSLEDFVRENRSGYSSSDDESLASLLF
jgi:hypothetical protein